MKKWRIKLSLVLALTLGFWLSSTATSLAKSSDVPTYTLKTPVLTTPQDGDTITKPYIHFTGTGNADQNVVVRINNRQARTVATTDSKGKFDFYTKIQGAKNKKLEVLLYTQDKSNDLISPTVTVDLTLGKQMNWRNVRGYLDDYCNDYKKIPGFTVKTWVIKYVEKKDGAKKKVKVFQTGSVQTDANGWFETSVPRTSAFLQATKKGYTTVNYSFDAKTTDGPGVYYTCGIGKKK